MLPYLFVFFISISCTFIAEKLIAQKNAKPLFYFFSFLAVIAPALLAGFRNPGIGTDTLIYAQDAWKQIIQVPDWQMFVRNYVKGNYDDFEFVYLFINYVASRFGRDIFWCFFFTNLSVVLPIYLALYDNRSKGNMWIGMAIFLFLYYNISFNMIRQSICLALCIYAVKYLEQRRYIRLIIWLLIIMNTHNTGSFFVLFCMIYLINSLRSGKMKKCLQLIFYGMIPLFLILFDLIILLAVNLNMLPERYIWYAVGDETLFDTMTSCSYIFILMCLFYIYINVTDKYSKQQVKYIAINKLFGIVLFLMSLVSKWTYRISYYLNYPIDILYIPRALYIMKNKNHAQYQIVLIALFSVMFFYWVWLFVVKGAHETYPYKSKLLGI